MTKSPENTQCKGLGQSNVKDIKKNLQHFSYKLNKDGQLDSQKSAYWRG